MLSERRKTEILGETSESSEDRLLTGTRTPAQLPPGDTTVVVCDREAEVLDLKKRRKVLFVASCPGATDGNQSAERKKKNTIDFLFFLLEIPTSIIFCHRPFMSSMFQTPRWFWLDFPASDWSTLWPWLEMFCFSNKIPRHSGTRTVSPSHSVCLGRGGACSSVPDSHTATRWRCSPTSCKREAPPGGGEAGVKEVRTQRRTVLWALRRPGPSDLLPVTFFSSSTICSPAQRRHRAATPAARWASIGSALPLTRPGASLSRFLFLFWVLLILDFSSLPL